MPRHQRALVTGGAGFIGSHLVDRLLAEDFEVTVLDNFSTGLVSNIQNHTKDRKLKLIKGDIRNKRKVKEAIADVDVVFHEAAISTSRESDVNLINEVNATGALILLNSSLSAGVERFVFASSAAVYGETDLAREDLLTKPISVYGASKVSAENYVGVFSRLYGLKTISLRYFNVYGSRQRFDSRYSAVITSFINRLMENKPPIIYGSGTQTRDFINVEDVVESNMLSMKSRCKGEPVNIASGKSISINKLATLIQRLMKKEHLAPTHADAKLGDIKNSSADTEKAKKLLGFQPRIKLEEGLTKLVNEYQKEKKTS